MQLLPTLPVLIPLTTALLCLASQRRFGVQLATHLAGAAALLAVGILLLADVSANGVRVVEMGGWPAPFAWCGHLEVDPMADEVVEITQRGHTTFPPSTRSWYPKGQGNRPAGD